MKSALAFSVFFLFVTAAPAQSDISSNPPVPSPATGLSSAGANGLSGIESVNTANGNVTLTFPLAQLPPDNVSLGGAGVSLVYNSAVYDAPAIPQSTSQADLEYTASAHGGGWNYGYQYSLWAQPRIPLVDMSSTVCGLLSAAEQTYWYKNFLQTPDGTNHILYRVDAIPSASGPTDDPTGTGFLSMDFAGFGNPNTTFGNCVPGTYQLQYTGTLIFATVDGSDIRVESTTHPGGQGTWIAYLPNGTQISGDISTALGNGSYYGEDSQAGTITDRNGNKVYIYGNCPTGGACQETISDVPGRMINLSFVSSGSNQNSWTDTISWTGPNGPVSANVNSTLTPMSGITYECGSTTSGYDGGLCPLNTSLWHVTSIQMPADSSGDQATFAMNYTPASGNQNWGELHTLTLQQCVGVGLTSCSSPQWTVNYNYLFDAASPLRPPGVTINPIASRTLSYSEILGTATTPLAETTNYSIWYPPSSVYTLLGGESISPPNTVKNPDGGTTTLYLSSLCATNTLSRDTCAPLIYKAVLPDNSQTELSYGWTTSFPAGIPAGTLVNPYIAINAEIRPNGATRAGQSTPDVNGNITNTYRYDWGTTITTNTNSLMTGVSCALPCTQLQTSAMTYNEQTTGALYWNPSADGTQPNLRAITSLAVNGSTTNSLSAIYSYDNATTTANLTSAQYGGISQSFSYFSNGNVETQTDPKGNVTITCYDNGSYNLYPQTVIVAASSSSTCPSPTEGPVGRESTYSTNFSSGVTVTASDADNGIATNYTYDNLGRQLTATQTGSGGLSRTATRTYDDVNLNVSTTQTDTPNPLITTTYYDPLGRVRLTVDGAGNQIASAYRYVSGNRLQLQSKPFPAGGSPPGWTLTTMDTVGRVIEVDHYSGSTPPAPWGTNTTKTGTVTFAYDLTLSGCTGPATSTTDEAGNTKYTCSDGLGRLTSVTEPNATTGAQGTVTTYGYDNLNNLISVDVSGQPTLSCPSNGGQHMRCFTYDSLSRLLSATNPESGTTYYTYDNNGNVLTRTDANGTMMTVAGYDGLNRPNVPTGSPAGTPAISYVAGGPAAATNAVAYAYDQGFKGALSSVCTSASTSPTTPCTSTTALSTTSYSYDGFGRVTASTQTTPPYSPFNFAYTYSPTDTLTSMTYPSQRQVNYALAAGDLVTTVQNVTGGGNYASSIGYTADGGLSTMTLGNAPDTVTQTYSWNDRFQPVGMTAGQVGQQPLLQLGLFPCPPINQINQTSCASGNGTGNNGNLLAQTITMPLSQTQNLTLTQTYTYDHLNRLTNAQETGGGLNWTQSYGYDTIGNLWFTTNSNLPTLTNETPQSQSWYSTTVPNRIASWSYDSNGNVLQIANVVRSFTYDGENNQVTATVGGGTSTYVYDGLGQRVAKTVAGQTTTYVYDAFGNLAAEYGGQSNGCGTCYVTTDHLGSTRLLTNSLGNVFARYDYEPFGTEIGANYDGRTTAMFYTSTPDANNPKFTGQQRDQESALDFFTVRYNSGAQGRFQSPDPGNAGADPSNPQSWNGYAYVGNSPLSYTDPSGESFWSVLAGIFSGLGTFLATGDPFLGAEVGLGVDNTVDSLENGQFPLAGLLDFAGIPAGLWGGGGQGSSSVSTGGVFGSGDTGPFIFSFEDQQQQELNGRLLLPNGDVAIWGIGGGQGGAVLKAAGQRAAHDLGCVVPGFATGSAGGGLVVSGQPNPGFRSPVTGTLVGGSKPFATPGASAGSSTLSSTLRDALPQRLPFRVPTPVGGPGTGRAFGVQATKSLGAAVGRWAPFLGWAGVAYGAYQVNSCLGAK